MDLSLILPVYNEETVIKETLKEITSFLNDQNLSYEIIVVDDGSTDRSVEVINELGLANLVLLEHQKNLGKGAAVRDGVLKAQGKLILFMDADNSTKITNLTRFLEKQSSEQAEIVIASRTLADSQITSHQIKLKETFGKLGNLMIRFLLVRDFKDTQCGFKLYSHKCKELFRLQKLNRWGFDFEILFLARKKDFKVIELPVVWQNHPESKVKFWDYFLTLKELFLVRYYYLTKQYEN